MVSDNKIPGVIEGILINTILIYNHHHHLTRFLPCDVLYNRKFISDDSLLKFRVTVRIEVDDYDFDRYTTKENEDDFIIVNDFVPINSSDGTGLG